MKILVTGSHGLVGTALVPFLTSQGHQVVCLVRSKPTVGQIWWDPDQEKLDRAQLEGFDAVVHLAGENIASSRWTEQKKAQLRESRIKGTKLLSKTLADLASPPQVFICASAIGYYGDRGVELLTEESPSGSGFLAELCRDWEAATLAAKEAGVRVVSLRIGVVLSTKGGALAQMLPPFQIGLGGPIGSGKQFFSWISVKDLVGIIHHVIITKELVGPVNAVTPNPITNLEFTKALGAALDRPTFFPVPAFGARLLFGKMADELLLASTRVQPKKLMATGYQFRQPKIDIFMANIKDIAI